MSNRTINDPPLRTYGEHCHGGHGEVQSCQTRAMNIGLLTSKMSALARERTLSVDLEVDKLMRSILGLNARDQTERTEKGTFALDDDMTHGTNEPQNFIA